MNTSNFKVQSCPLHPNIQWTQFCCQGQGIKRVCRQCEDTECKAHRQNHITYLHKDVDDLKEIQDKAICRHKQITQLQRTFAQSYDREDQQTYIKLQTNMEIEAEDYKKSYARIEVLRKRLNEIVKLHQYFKFMGDHELYEIKLNLSSPKGLRKFHQKVMAYRRSFNKQVQFGKILEELERQQQKLQILEQFSLASQLSSLCCSLKQKQKSALELNKQSQCQPQLKAKRSSSKSSKQTIE